MQDLNRTTITGRLAADPEQPSDSVTRLRVAVNGRAKGDDGEWRDAASFFDVTVFGAQGRACAEHLSKGSPVAVDGRFEQNTWTTENGDRRERVRIVASLVRFLESRTQTAGDGGDDRDDIPF